MRGLAKRAFAPVDAASLGLFRVGFGAIMLWEVWRYFDRDWISAYYIEPAFHFTYLGFGWVQPWPGSGMVVHFAALGALAVAIALGLFYRVATLLFALGFAHVFLIEQARYLNHFYLIVLLAFLLSVVDAHRAFSLDARRSARPPTVPAWQLWLLRAQLGIVYVYGGLAKLNPEWLAGEPMRTFLARRTHYPVVGPLFTDETMVYLFSYGGLLIDLLVVPFLLWRRTRAEAFLVVVFFHVTNAWLFRIGIFPWLMIVATTLFFDPAWPRRMLRPLRIRAALPPPEPGRFPFSRRTLVFAGAYLALQLLVPLRHHLYPGPALWTEEGHAFSWRMMLRDKETKGDFVATDGNGLRIAFVDPWDEMPRWQVKAMFLRPHMIQQYAHHIAERLRAAGHEEVRVYARVRSSLHGRPPQRLIDDDVDLAAEPRGFGHARWIEPLRDYLVVESR